MSSCGRQAVVKSDGERRFNEGEQEKKVVDSLWTRGGKVLYLLSGVLFPALPFAGFRSV
jgi:hypothetical protein